MLQNTETYGTVHVDAASWCYLHTGVFIIPKFSPSFFQGLSSTLFLPALGSLAEDEAAQERTSRNPQGQNVYSAYKKPAKHLSCVRHCAKLFLTFPHSILTINV